MADVIMPKMGDAMEEGVIVQLLRKVGDNVGPDDPVFEIETDKSNVEVPAGVAGTIHEIRFAAGATVKVGVPVVVIGDGPPPAGGATAAPAPVATPVVAPQTQAADVPTTPEPVAVAPAAASTPVTVVTDTVNPLGDTYAGALPEGLGGSASVLGVPITLANDPEPARVKASPLARAIAAANHLSLASIRTDGPVKAADVQALLAVPAATTTAPPAAPAASAPVTDDDIVQEYNAMRRTIARRLTESKQSTPHIYVTVEIDMEALLALRERLNASATNGAPKVSVNDCIVRGCALALVENPNVNSRFDNNRRIISKQAHIGVAVSLPDGLIVPVVRSAQARTLRQIAAETKRLAETARSGKLQPSDYQGGTFTISNMGAIADVENFCAIINPGEGAILAVSSTRTIAAVVDNAIVARRRMKVTLSADHRVVDGSDAAQFLGSLKRLLENPLELMA
jgi:pyruvate dehydrogenase E2 component (dihydrolipoamide acetyltransferase)